MNVEDQVCNLELSKKLKELGIKQESLFYWAAHENPLDGVFDENKVKYWRCDIYHSHFVESSDYRYSAFTASELLEILPNTITLKENDPLSNYRFEMTRVVLSLDGKIFERYSAVNYGATASKGYPLFFNSLLPPIHDTNLANACAKLLIHLIDNKLIEVKNDYN